MIIKALGLLNSLCKAKLRGQPIEPRSILKESYTCVISIILWEWIKSLIAEHELVGKKRTVNIWKPPMLRLTVASLAKLVEDSPSMISTSKASKELQINMEGGTGTESNAIDSHLRMLTTSISELLSND